MTEKRNAPQSPITIMSRKFRNFDYPLTVRVIDQHLVITSPDFNFPVPIVLPFNPPQFEIAGKALIAAWLQIHEQLKTQDMRSEPHPIPKEMKNHFPRLSKEISLGEACRLTGLKATLLRELADQGEIPCRRTPRGHRRFLRDEIEKYAADLREAFRKTPIQITKRT